MQEQKHYQYGIFSWFGWVMPLPQRLDFIKKAGFDTVTIWWEDEIGSPGIKKERMPGMVRAADLVLENIHVPYDDIDDLWSESLSRREKIVTQYIRWLNDCAQLQIPVLLMHIIDRNCPSTPNKYGIECISRLVQTAQDLGVALAIENTGSVDYIDFVLKEIPSDYLGFCYDSSHDFIYSHDKARILERQGKRLTHLHLSDNDLEHDRHWLPGEGMIDWLRIAELFPREIYKGNLTLEVHPKEEDVKKPPEDFLNKAYNSAACFQKLLQGY